MVFYYDSAYYQELKTTEVWENVKLKTNKYHLPIRGNLNNYLKNAFFYKINYPPNTTFINVVRMNLVLIKC